MPEPLGQQELPDGVGLFRRIHPNFVGDDHNKGDIYPADGAWRESEEVGPVSLFREDILEELGVEAEELLDGYEGHGLVRVPAEHVRSQAECNIYSDDDGSALGPAHVVLSRATRSQRKRLRNGSEWIVRPAGRPYRPPESG